MKRHQALEQARQADKLGKMKEDMKIRREIVAATRESSGGLPRMARMTDQVKLKFKTLAQRSFFS